VIKSGQMTRRDTLLLLVPRSAKRPPTTCVSPAPQTDIERLNRFAQAYNAYVARLRDGIIDPHRWRLLVQQASRLFGFDLCG